ncbi:double-strand break repair helicase AddA [Rhodobacteraceae bacterium 2CG4]|uniref:DNA 3'-5' helicase n=1 Tax=Halovulum marinum TaxID=2662447 RepID=A0A6L5YYN8_9RHOB|nr:double-strand break repair helicase AddA [Halovulum marinum]MSU89431.1 double-strand break repair helicase AddA [Halovulum marinum]
MSGRDAATEAQVRAARPDASSWVAANAGSGKTRVLTDRVARLLLRGTDPRRILCLTFTKAAAGEMQNRLFARLGKWAMLDDAALRAELHQLDESARGISDRDLAAARTLFARALETPGGLKIQTIHAFCEALLRRFPLEAGVSPQFEVLEDRRGLQLRQTLLEELAEDPASGFAALAPHILSLEFAIDGLLRDILKHRRRFAHQPASPAIAAAFGLGDPPPAPLHGIAAARLEALLSALSAAGGKSDRNAHAALVALRKGEDPAGDLVCAGFLKKDGTPLKTMCTAATSKALAEAPALLARIADALVALRDHARTVRAVDCARALTRFARAYIAAHDARKQALGALDFDDLIEKALALLTRSDAAEWIRYRLDGGIEHVLVDEAQDTSRTQWAVIDALTREFFAGEGAHQRARTVFVVGDEKQSIYSFQGAEPREFGLQRKRYADALHDVELELQECALLHSFRSAPPILRLVDAVFDGRAPAQGGAAEHVPFHDARPGRVELLPFLTPDEPGAPEPWYLPVDQPKAADPRLALARQLALRVRDLLAAGRPLPGTGRPVAAGDILFLVRGRGTLFGALISELKAAGVPVAGADRLKIAEVLAVRDLLSLLRAVATDADDLALAEAMRSPLMALSEADLFRLAHGRTGTLARALRARRADFPQAWALWEDLRNRADFLRPYEMLQRILVRHGGRARIRARMGAEADEAVAALLDLALDYERVEPPTLTGFLDWMGSGDPEVKRQLDSRAGEVRVMTVHGAKGLEAPVVILPETDVPRGNRAGGAPLRALGPGVAALAGTRAERPPALQAAEDVRAAQEAEERWRLLYVALTRAERWLIVAGAGPKQPDDPDKAWYAAVAQAMDRLGAGETADGARVLAEHWDEGPSAAVAAVADAPAAEPLPAWATIAAAPPPAPETPLAPSRDGGEHEADPDLPAGALTADEARARGLHLHLLLEHLPHAAPEARAARAAALLPDLDAPARAALLAEAEALLADPALAWIFAPGALAEVPLTGRLASLGGRKLRGQIDRLIVTPETVWAIDFKTDASPPPPGAPLPPAYAGQLALYALALAEIYPGRPVRAAVLWTGARRLTELDHDAVTAIRRTHAAY